jgi:rod shape-determining protein MreD
MRYAFAGVIAWLLAVVWVSAMPYVKVLGVTPDLVLIFACCWAVVRGDEEALYVVPIAAIAHDLMSSDPVGTSLLAFAPIVLLATVARLQAIDTDFIPAVAVVAAGSLSYEVIHIFVLAVIGQPIEADYALLRVIIPAAVVNALFTPILYLPVRWLSSERSSVLRGAGRLTSPL